MKRKHPTLTIVATLILIGGFLMQPAKAGISISISSGHHHQHSAYCGHNYKRKHYYQRSYPRKYNSHGYGYRDKNHRRYGKHAGYKNKHLGRYDCHAVSKWAYGDYGQKLKIGGTMCYDAYGQSYVVPGSRYLIRQY